jgi:hypothetical protein
VHDRTDGAAETWRPCRVLRVASRRDRGACGDRRASGRIGSSEPRHCQREANARLEQSEDPIPAILLGFVQGGGEPGWGLAGNCSHCRPLADRCAKQDWTSIVTLMGLPPPSRSLISPKVLSGLYRKHLSDPRQERLFLGNVGFLAAFTTV